MKHIGNLTYAEGAKSKSKRIGRGPGSGHGGTSTRGHKGQKSRSGAKISRFKEGGQMPINRRLPKFGFFNRFRVEYQTVNVSRLQELVDNNCFENNSVTFESLFQLGVIKKKSLPLKILGNGDLTAALNITAHKFSESAKNKIESAGGTVIINE
ncbi:MAG: 50S ribosomal protein L15 [Candidatus Kapabacteria bacterium]|nr:50S ribosomal protein L15 [Ignavibacteriota bacterium]MCW5884039.1 50S ribosomal protein L15 [Candidatus Kapabacteria bacterium]